MSHQGMHGDAMNSSGAHWKDAETRLLIKLWRQPQTLAEVNDTSSRQKCVYKRIAKKIVSAGYFRDAGQIKNKIRTMTTNYKRFSKMGLEERANWTGQGKQCFQYFNELREFLDVDTSGEASGHDDGDSPISTEAQQNRQAVVLARRGVTGCRLQRIKLEDNRQQEHSLPTTVVFDTHTGSSNLTNNMNDGASLHLNQRNTPDHQLHQLPNGNFYDNDGQVTEMVDPQEAEVGWISDEDEIESGEPRAKVRCHMDLSNNHHNPKRESRKSQKKEETVKELVMILMENNMQRDKVLMEAEDVHRRMEAERHTEEIRLLRDQIQLERDRLQFEREERERMELIRREEAARAERLRREEMERSEKVRLDERDREERRFTLMMALIKGAQNHHGN